MDEKQSFSSGSSDFQKPLSAQDKERIKSVISSFYVDAVIALSSKDIEGAEKKYNEALMKCKELFDLDLDFAKKEAVELRHQIKTVLYEFPASVEKFLPVLEEMVPESENPPVKKEKFVRKPPVTKKQSLEEDIHSLWSDAFMFSRKGDLIKTEIRYSEALDKCKELAEIEPVLGKEKALEIKLEQVQVFFERPSAREKCYPIIKEILPDLKKRYDSNPGDYAKILANIYFIYGVACGKVKDFSGAENAFASSIDLYKVLASENPENYAFRLATAYKEFADLCFFVIKTESGREKSEKLYCHALDIAEKFSQNRPFPYGEIIVQVCVYLSLIYSRKALHQDVIRILTKGLEMHYRILDGFDRTDSGENEDYLYEYGRIAEETRGLAVGYCKNNEMEKGEILFLKSIKMFQQLININDYYKEKYSVSLSITENEYQCLVLKK